MFANGELATTLGVEQPKTPEEPEEAQGAEDQPYQSLPMEIEGS